MKDIERQGNVTTAKVDSEEEDDSLFSWHATQPLGGGGGVAAVVVVAVAVAATTATVAIVAIEIFLFLFLSQQINSIFLFPHLIFI